MPSCAFCAKEYKHRTLLLRHERICGITYEKRTRDDDESTPSLRDLYEVVLHLVDENKRLQEKVKRLTTQQQRSWNLEEALGTHIPSQSFREWTKSLLATPRHLECVFDHGRVEGLTDMVTEFVESTSLDLPLRAFRQRKDTIYAYDDGKWSKMETSDWNLFLNTLDKLLRIQFYQWQQENTSQLMNPTFQELYITNMRKLNGKANQGEVTKVKRAMYTAITERVVV